MSSVRFKTGSLKEIQVVALNKTETQYIYQCFSPEWGGGGGGHTLGIRQLKTVTAFGNLTDDFGTGTAP